MEDTNKRTDRSKRSSRREKQGNNRGEGKKKGQLSIAVNLSEAEDSKFDLDEPYCDYSEVTIREKLLREKNNLCVFCAKKLPDLHLKQQKYCKNEDCVLEKRRAVSRNSKRKTREKGQEH
jgi:hypothetical protein